MIEFIIEDQPDQQFSIILENRRVTMRLVYNQTSERWSFDMSIDDLPILHGRRIVTGVDLLKSFDFGVGVLFAAPMLDGFIEPDRTGLVDGRVKIFHTTETEIENTIDPITTDPQTPNVLPIVWTEPEPEYFGSSFNVGRLLNRIKDGFAIDFLADEILIRSNDDPNLNFIGTLNASVDTGRVEYFRPSDAYHYGVTGRVTVAGPDVLRMQHDLSTGVPVGVLLEPASVNLVTESTVEPISVGLVVNENLHVAPDGTMTADEVIENLTDGPHSVAVVAVPGVTVGQRFMWSIFVKKTDNPRNLCLRTSGARDAHQLFDPNVGVWASDSVGSVSRGFEELPDGWFRVWMIVEASSPGTLFGHVQFSNGSLTYPGDNVSGLILWGRDMRQVNRKVEHFITTGIAEGPALDTLQIPLSVIPWMDGTGQFLVNGIVVIPTIVIDKIVFPTNIEGPIKTVAYRVIE